MNLEILAAALLAALSGLWLLNRATGNFIGSQLGFGVDKKGSTETIVDQDKVNTGRRQLKVSNVILIIVVILILVALLVGQGGG